MWISFQPPTGRTLNNHQWRPFGKVLRLDGHWQCESSGPFGQTDAVEGVEIWAIFRSKAMQRNRSDMISQSRLPHIATTFMVRSFTLSMFVSRVSLSQHAWKSARCIHLAGAILSFSKQFETHFRFYSRLRHRYMKWMNLDWEGQQHSGTGNQAAWGLINASFWGHTERENLRKSTRADFSLLTSLRSKAAFYLPPAPISFRLMKARVQSCHLSLSQFGHVGYVWVEFASHLVTATSRCWGSISFWEARIAVTSRARFGVSWQNTERHPKTIL